MLFARLTTRRTAHHLLPRHAREEAAKYNDQSSLEEALTVSRSEFCFRSVLRFIAALLVAAAAGAAGAVFAAVF